MKREFIQLTISIAVSALFALLVSAQEPSPAGGGWLELNGIDSYAVCRDNDSLDKDLEDFSIEAWIYPRGKPKRDERRIIAKKPGRYELALLGSHRSDNPWHNIKDFAIALTIYWDEAETSYSGVSAWKERPGSTFPDDFAFNQWHHIVVRYHEKVTWVDGTIKPMMVMLIDGNHVASAGLHEGWTPANTRLPLYVGGIENREGSYFDGYIDKLRISGAAEPILIHSIDMQAMNFLFDLDRETVGLWHFDEPEGAAAFHDASGNGNTLFRRGGGFSVASNGRLATTWAGIKSGLRLQ